jgi:hypothetical protein
LATGRPSHPERQRLPSDDLQLEWPLLTEAVIDRPMAATPDEIQEAVARMWANELGGPLMEKLLDELHGSKTPLQEEPVLFKASEEKFLAAGKTKLEHECWRQQELKPLRIKFLEYQTWMHNREHPRYANEEDENFQAGGWPPLYIPGTTIEELDTNVTDWYLKKEKDTLFKLPEGAKSDALPSEPASITYMKWENRMGMSKLEINKASRTSGQNTVKKPQEELSGKWRLINSEDLEGEELTAEQVRKMIIDLLGLKGVAKQKVVKDLLEEAQSSASKFSRDNEDIFPVRLHKESEYLLEWFAMTKRGAVGRPSRVGEIANYTGSLYRLIQKSPFAKASTRQTP